jgi:RecB family exonuclease
MPLTLIRSRSNSVLWSSCAEAFLDELGAHTGPAGYPSYLWIAHRNQRDSLLELAVERGLKGWLEPPLAFLSELPALFAIQGRPISTMTRRFLVARLGANEARRVGFGPADTVSAADEAGDRHRLLRSPLALGRTPMLDGLFSELLPEGVTPAALREALGSLSGDAFTHARNEWIAGTYEAYLRELSRRGLYDPRAIHSAVAARIEEGGLGEALRGAARLHIYGIYTPHVRRRLLRALRAQRKVDVRVYVTGEEEGEEWDGLGADFSDLPPARRPEPDVQPAPDALREARWIAEQVKRILAQGLVEPHEVAVVARSGRDDSRRLHRVFAAAGIPSTARVRTPLSQVPALKTILELFRGAALGWPHRSLRHALASPYLSVGLDLRAIDRVAGKRRPDGLSGWAAALELILDVELDSEEGRKLSRAGIRPERVEKDLAAFREFAEAVRPLAGPRSEDEWIDATLLLAGDSFDFRRRLCRPVADRWDIVRLDQQGVRELEGLLRQWRDFAETTDAIRVGEWHARLRRLLEGTELALTTPQKKGVQILEAHEAALTPFRRTFVIHANDGVFPRRVPYAGILSDEEREHLSRQAGLPVTCRDDHLRRERTLWRAVTAAADVTVTYRTTDTNGTPRLPSLMVPEHDPADELPRFFDLDAEPLRPAQAHRRSALEFAAAKRRRMGERVATPAPTGLRGAILAAFAEVRRAGREPSLERLPLRAHPWHGELRDPAVLAYLGKRFGDDHLWSAGQLQSYSGCPFFFLVTRVLRLDEIGEVEEETSPLVFGSIAHDVLERFYERYTKRPPPEELAGEAEELYERAVDEALAAVEERGDWIGVPALWATTRHRIREAIRSYLKWELGVLRKNGERPYTVEHAFGYRGTPPVTISGVDLRGSAGELLLCGRVDRVDVVGADESALYQVLDYKSGGYPARKQYEDGSLLQTPLYMEVLALSGLNITSGYFRSIKTPKTQHGSKVVRGDQRYRTALATAFSIPARVRAGLFEPVKSANTKWETYELGIDVCRTRAQLPPGETRFDDVTRHDGGFGLPEKPGE